MKETWSPLQNLSRKAYNTGEERNQEGHSSVILGNEEIQDAQERSRYFYFCVGI